MARSRATAKHPNVLAVLQGGRLEFEAALFAVSFRAANPGFEGRLIFAEPQPGPRWGGIDPRSHNPDVRALLADHGAEIQPFDTTVFGHGYPYGNKIEALKVLPPKEPFIFFDTDTLHLGPLADAKLVFSKPSASLRREGTWPQIELYGPGYAEIWKSLYDKFGLDFDSSLDLSQPDEYWRRYLYFNAGFYFYNDPKVFHERFVTYATGIRDDAPRTLECQNIWPWLDQIALPLVIHSLGGGRAAGKPGMLDGQTTCHYRVLPLLYARESDQAVETLERVTAPNKIKKVLKQYEPFKKMIFQKKGHKVRALFDQDNLPRREQPIRNKIKREGLWLR